MKTNGHDDSDITQLAVTMAVDGQQGPAMCNQIVALDNVRAATRFPVTRDASSTPHVSPLVWK